MSNSAIKQWKDGLMSLILEGEAAVQKKIQQSLETVERDIAEEEAVLRMKREKLRTKKDSVVAEEETLKQTVETKRAENAEARKQLEKLKPVKEELKLFCRLHGRSLITHLRVNYKDKPGKILCPEGKVCAAKNPADEECNYWDCPGLQKLLQGD